MFSSQALYFTLLVAAWVLPVTLHALSVCTLPRTIFEPPPHYCKIMARAPVICVTHGGGPMPILNDSSQKDITLSLSTKVPKILKLGTPEAPKAIVLITAHWETEFVTISNGSKHDLYYDYGGFPAETYKLKYNAPGSPEVARAVAEALKTAGLKSVMDSKRGKLDPSIGIDDQLTCAQAGTTGSSSLSC